MLGTLSMAAIATAAALAGTGSSVNNEFSNYEKGLNSQHRVVQSTEYVTPKISDGAQKFIDDFVNSFDYQEVTSNNHTTITPMSSSGKPQSTWKKDIDGSNILKGIPNYSDEQGQWLLQNIRPGDIIYQPNSDKNHTVLVENVCVYYYYGDNGVQTGIYIRIIEATTLQDPDHALGKVIRSVFDTDSFYSGCKIYRVIGATSGQISGAIDFAIGQLGKGYGFSWGYDENNTWWYCSKLCAAAYMSQGVSFPIAEENPLEYTPNNLISESCLYQISLPGC